MIKTRAHKTQRWFYGINTKTGQMILENNQCFVARTHNLIQSSLSGCLFNRTASHRGWRFCFVGNAHKYKPKPNLPAESRMTSEEFKAIQTKIGLVNSELAKKLGRGTSTIQHYRAMTKPVTESIAEKMRSLAAAPAPEDPQTSLEIRVSAYIRNYTNQISEYIDLSDYSKGSTMLESRETKCLNP